VAEVCVSDKALQQSIERRILRDQQLSAFTIQVEVLNGTVTLRGRVPTSRAKLAAQELVRSTPGCRTVLNEIQVEPAKGISDHRVADEIRALLDENPELSKGAITVEVQAGRVTLSGAVATPEEYAVAEDAARSAHGVREVHNHLLIDRTAQDDDESLQLEIESALASVPELRDFDLKVAVSADTIVLSGQVIDDRQKALAQEVARGVRPWRIRNEIDVAIPRSVPGD